MTRFGFFLFNTLLVALLYLFASLGQVKVTTVGYVLRDFSIPYTGLILAMIVIGTVRWFMHHDPEVGREVGTWVIAFFYVPLITAAALYLTGTIDFNNFSLSLHKLLYIR